MAGNERWYAIIYYQNGSMKKCANTDSRQATARMAQMIYDQDMRTASSAFFKPVRIEIVKAEEY